MEAMQHKFAAATLQSGAFNHHHHHYPRKIARLSTALKGADVVFICDAVCPGTKLGDDFVTLRCRPRLPPVDVAAKGVVVEAHDQGQASISSVD